MVFNAPGSVEVKNMNEREDGIKPCHLGEIDHQGRSNLCFYFPIDEQGNYYTPCHMPLEECCIASDT